MDYSGMTLVEIAKSDNKRNRDIAAGVAAGGAVTSVGSSAQLVRGAAKHANMRLGDATFTPEQGQKVREFVGTKRGKSLTRRLRGGNALALAGLGGATYYGLKARKKKK